MEGYFYAGGCAEFPLLGKQFRLPNVKSDVEKVTDLFQSRLRLKPVFPGLDALETPLLQVLSDTHQWSGERHDEIALVFYYATHGICEGNDGLRLCHAESERSDSGDLNPAQLVKAELIAECLKGGSIKQLLLILDCCHAAAGTSEIRRVFEKFDGKFSSSSGVRVDLIVAARAREYANDGGLPSNLAKAVETIGSEAEGSHLPIEKVVTVLKERTDTALQTVEYHPVIGHLETSVVFPNPEPLIDAAQDRKQLGSLKEIIANHGDEANDQQRLWFAWFDRGKIPSKTTDTGWFAHAEERMERPLDGEIVPIVRMIEGLACIEPELEAALHAWQENYLEGRSGDLQKSRASGIALHREYGQWLEENPVEIQVSKLLPDEPGRVVPVVLENVEGKTYRFPLPMLAGHDSDVARCFDALVQMKEPALRFLVPHEDMNAAHGEESYEMAGECIAFKKVCKLTLHPYERWFDRKWALVRNKLKRFRIKMASKGAVQVVNRDNAEVSQALKAGAGVILAADDQEGFQVEAWEEWPEMLLGARESDDAIETFLVFDGPEYLPWNLPNRQLFEQ